MPLPQVQSRLEDEPRESRSCRLDDLPALEKRWKSLSKERKGRLGKLKRRNGGGGAETGAPERRQVGASIAVHPPKFYAASFLLEEWYFCPAAFAALSVFLVFSTEADLELFKEAQACLSPEVPDSAWTGVVAKEPAGHWPSPGGSGNQLIAAYKKWHGVAHMMDLGAEAPDYGLMLDSEIVLYDHHARKASGKACSPGGLWSSLFDRIRSNDVQRSFPAARVSRTHTTYNFGAYTKSGQDYDRILIRENLDFVWPTTPADCTTAGCAEVRRQERECLFSWWTDLPWVNLTVASRMLVALARKPVNAGFRELSAAIRFPRFEYIAYQQWCVLHEDFHIRDVTSLTGEAKWGSYLEDPLPGARISELRPLWISTAALSAAERGSIPEMAEAAPPLLIFHADHEGARYYARVQGEKEVWEELILGLLKRHKRKDFDRNTIK